MAIEANLQGFAGNLTRAAGTIHALIQSKSDSDADKAILEIPQRESVLSAIKELQSIRRKLASSREFVGSWRVLASRFGEEPLEFAAD